MTGLHVHWRENRILMILYIHNSHIGIREESLRTQIYWPHLLWVFLFHIHYDIDKCLQNLFLIHILYKRSWRQLFETLNIFDMTDCYEYKDMPYVWYIYRIVLNSFTCKLVSRSLHCSVYRKVWVGCHYTEHKDRNTSHMTMCTLLNDYMSLCFCHECVDRYQHIVLLIIYVRNVWLLCRRNIVCRS